MLRLDFDGLIRRSLAIVGDSLVETAKQNMAEVSHGRAYIVGGRTHIASKPFDTANNMTGALSDTIRYEMQGNELVFGAGDSTVDYAKYLETGTRNMEARPNYYKTIEQCEQLIDREIQARFNRAVRFSNA